LLCTLVQHVVAVIPAMPAVTEEEAATLDRAKFHETYRTEKPVVIKGLVRSWPAYKRWEPAQLKRLVGNLVVQPFIAFDNVHFLENRDVVERREMPLAQVIEHVFEGRDVVLSAQPAGNEDTPASATAPRWPWFQCVCATGAAALSAALTGAVDPRSSNGAASVAAVGALAALVSQCCSGTHAAATANRIYLRGAVFNELKEDINVPTFMDGGPAKLSDDLSGIWIGSKGCITPLHFDAWHGVLCQVRGRKRVTLFAPEDTDNMYPRKQEDGMNMHTSELVLEQLDLPGCPAAASAGEVDADYMSKYPLAKTITPYTVDLEPGDALYIPPFWWHHVSSLDASISVPLRWQMKIMGDRTNAVRNVGFRGWRRNREKLRDDDNEGGRGDSAKEANKAAQMTEDEIMAKVAKLQKRKDLIDLGVVSDVQAVREAVVAAEGHVGRAAIALRKQKQAVDKEPISADDV
jgi:hypothetical protein